MPISQTLTFAKQLLIRSKNGLLGQILTFLAMLLPIFTKRLEQLQFLIIVSAIGSILALIGTWSFPSVFPSLREKREATTSLVATITVIATVFAVCLVIYLLPTSLDARLRDIVFWSAWFMLAQGGYLIVLAIAVREQRYHTVNDLRLIYGITSFCLTLVACGLGKHHASLALAASLAFALAAIITLLKEVPNWRTMVQAARTVPLVAVRKYLVTYSDAAVAGVISGIAFQLGAILLTGFGATANAWAIVLRISGGFTTVSGQLIAPIYEIHFTRELRQKQFSVASDVQRSALISGLALSVGGMLAIALSLWYSNALRPFQPLAQNTIILCAVVYTVAILSTANIMKNVVLAGGRRQYLVWIILKVSLSLAILPQLTGNAMLVGLSCVEILFQGSYIALAFLRLRILNRDYSLQITSGQPAVAN